MCDICYGKKYYLLYLYNEKELEGLRLSDNSSKFVRLVERYEDVLSNEHQIEFENVIVIKSLKLLNNIIEENRTNIEELKDSFLKIRLKLLNPTFTYAKRCEC